MKKKILPLMVLILVIILPGCKKILDGIVPVIPDGPTLTAVGTPVGGIATKMIGKNGGSLVSADGNAELIFPAGALDNDKPISIQAVTQTTPNGVGLGYQFLPEGIKFLQPVTLKFHYKASDLASTLGDLMGISFQDSTGGWWRLKNFSNDTINKVITASIRHFTVYAVFDCLSITPPKGDLKVGASMLLNIQTVLTDDEDLATLGPIDEELAPLKKITSQKVIWSANGIVNGNAIYGTVTSETAVEATFKAPAKVPNANPVAVSGQVFSTFKYHGKTFSNTTLVSNITITDGQKYLLEIRQTETAPPFIYKDTASLVISVSSDGKISVADIANFAPVTTPEIATVGDCTATWIKDAVGEMNITNVNGTISGSAGDPARVLILHFSHSGTVVPKFKQACAGAGEVTYGGIAIAGFPVLLSFTLTRDGGIYFIDDGQEFARLTLQ